MDKECEKRVKEIREYGDDDDVSNLKMHFSHMKKEFMDKENFEYIWDEFTSCFVKKFGKK